MTFTPKTGFTPPCPTHDAKGALHKASFFAKDYERCSNNSETVAPARSSYLRHRDDYSAYLREHHESVSLNSGGIPYNIPFCDLCADEIAVLRTAEALLEVENRLFFVGAPKESSECLLGSICVELKVQKSIEPNVCT